MHLGRFWAVCALVSQHVLLAQAAQLAKHALLQGSLEAGTWAKQAKDEFDLNTCDSCMRYNEDFCKGFVVRQVGQLVYAVRGLERNSPSAKQFCLSFLGVCDPPGIQEWKFPFPSLPFCDMKPPGPPQRKKKKKKKPLQPLKVVHFSDIHFDNLYVAGASNECTQSICCRGPPTPDIPTGNPLPKIQNVTSPAGRNGDHNCGVPESLERSLYKEIRNQAFSLRGAPKTVQRPLILFTGDILDQLISNVTEIPSINHADRFYTKMKSLFKSKAFYSTLGNHDSNSANLFEPRQTGGTTVYLYNITGALMEWFVGAEARKTIESFGGYSTKVAGHNLRIISLNTNLYNRLNFSLYQLSGMRDIEGQLYWLAQELDKAEKAGENVYIIGHMPMGHPEALPDQSNYFDQIVQRYAVTIRGMFFGHTHQDEFELSYSDYARRDAQHATATSYICPSVATDAGMPAFRVYDVDPETYAVLDVHTYMADMADPAFHHRRGPRWTRYYSAREAYGWVAAPPLGPRDELTPAFWHNVTEAMERNATLFDEYVLRKSRGWIKERCEGECKERELCQLRAARSQDNCEKRERGAIWGFTSKNGKNGNNDKNGKNGNHGKRNDEDVQQRPKLVSCGGSDLPGLLRELLSRRDLLEQLQASFVAEKATIKAWRDEPLPMRTWATLVDDGVWNATRGCIDRNATNITVEAGWEAPQLWK